MPRRASRQPDLASLRGRPRKTGAVAARPVRDEILLAAGRLIAQHGYSGTSTADIAAAVGLTQPAIFYHFKSKEEIFRNLLYESLVEPLAELEVVLATQASSASKLYRMVVFQVTHDLGSDLPLGSIIDDLRRLPRSRFRDVFEKERRYSHAIRQLIERGIRAGQFRKVDPFTAAMGILGMCNWALRWFHKDKPLSPADVGRAFGDLALTSLLADPEVLPAVVLESRDLENLRPKPTPVAARKPPRARK